MIFTNFNSSSNYDDTKKRRGVGRNGSGAKLTALFSGEFTVETVCPKNKKKYLQTFDKNLTVIGPPKITSATKTKPYTQITWVPDFPRFEMTKEYKWKTPTFKGKSVISPDVYALLKKKAYDLAAFTPPTVAVYFCSERIAIKKFDDYVRLHLADDTPFVITTVSPDCQIAVARSTGQFHQVSLVNCVPTTNGGSHINVISRKLCKDIAEALSKKNKTISPAMIQKNIQLFVKLSIDNPEFDSQTKKCLTNKLTAKDLGLDKIPESFIKSIITKCDIKDIVLRETELREEKTLAKTGGTKKSRLFVPKLEDARNAGTAKSSKTVLILTEGDSAKALAVAGLTVIGQDNYGVFPLRGKMLNVRDASASKVSANTEITYLKQIIGLQHGEKYNTPEKRAKLRYGHILILTDQDVDGSHIKGLIQNFIDTYWPELLQTDFIRYLNTPIIKVSHGPKKKRKVISFYNLIDYSDWRAKNEDLAVAPSTEIKYYKGLGTSTTKEAKEYFSPVVMAAQCKALVANTPECTESLSLAFDKKKADDRKEWLMKYTHTSSDAKLAELRRIKDAATVSIRDFVEYELVEFSTSDNIRSLPSAIDGFKPSQRIAIFIATSKVATREMKVENLASVVSTETDYHHGANSLQECIISLAQNFVGSNNINLLLPNGQFGTRLMGGKDHSAARYIMTQMNPLAAYIFRKEDYPLHKLQENGVPEHLISILPMVLVNGADGIGTGYSVRSAPLNVVDIIHNIKLMMKGETELPELVPYFHHFTGTVVELTADDASDASYTTRANYHRVDKQTIEILDLPIGVWSENYTAFLENILSGKTATGKEATAAAKMPDYGLRSYESKFVETPYGDTNKIFSLTFTAARLNEWLNDIPNFEKTFKLIGSGSQQRYSTSNLHMFTADGKLVKYESYNHILADFYTFRLAMYERRKAHLLGQYQLNININEAKIRFIEDFTSEKITIVRRKRADIIADLVKHDYPQFVEYPDYSYLLDIKIYNLTLEEMEKLRKKYEAAKADYAALKGKTVKQLWTEELDEFLAQYHKANAME